MFKEFLGILDTGRGKWKWSLSVRRLWLVARTRTRFAWPRDILFVY